MGVVLFQKNYGRFKVECPAASLHILKLMESISAPQAGLDINREGIDFSLYSATPSYTFHSEIERIRQAIFLTLGRGHLLLLAPSGRYWIWIGL